MKPLIGMVRGSRWTCHNLSSCNQLGSVRKAQKDILTATQYRSGCGWQKSSVRSRRSRRARTYLSLSLSQRQKWRHLWLKMRDRPRTGQTNTPTAQCCEMNFFKSARYDVKIRRNPPCRIGLIRQKSVQNWELLCGFHPLGVLLCGFLMRIWPYLRSGPGKIFFSLKIF
jgi:hypothetical protein